VGPKEQINDCILRTGDRLMQAIAIGDGVIVVPQWEGSQGQFNIKKTTCGKPPRFPLIETKVRSYYSIQKSKRVVHIRGISSKALNDINVYKKAYGSIKSKLGNMTPGIDLETLDGMSIRIIEKLRKDIIS